MSGPAMDVRRTPAAKRRPRLPLAIGGAALVGVIAWSALRSGDVAIERSAVVIDSVTRGELLLEVRGSGTLAPERSRFLTALTSARVERVLAQSGERIAEGALLLELANPDVEIRAMEAERALSRARADRIALAATRQETRLVQRGVVAALEAQGTLAEQDRAVAESLAARAMISRVEATTRRVQAADLGVRTGLERERLRIQDDRATAELRELDADIARLEAIAAFQRDRVRSLAFRAPETGVLQDLAVQPGQWITEGSALGRIIDPSRLKAVVRIPEAQVRDVRVGQRAMVDTRLGMVPGHVVRRDAAAQGGSVAVDIALDAPLPAGAVPDQTVDAVITVARVTEALRLGRPAVDGATALYRVNVDGRRAERVPVRIGRAGVRTVEILGGLAAGDRVIVSDVSAWNPGDRIRIR